MNPSSASRHPKATAFAAWIAGYQDFYEPIVRAWFADKGMRSCSQRSVGGRELLPSIAALETAVDRIGSPAECYSRALSVLKRKSLRGRVQLDLLLQLPTGVITGECKSWGGYFGPVTWALANKLFVEGPDGLFLYLTEIRGQPVVESRLVLWKRSADHDDIERRLTGVFRRTVRLHYLDEIIRDAGPATRAECSQRLQLLSDAMELVKSMIEPCELV